MNRTIAGTELSVFPLCLGSNVFGWTVDERDVVRRARRLRGRRRQLRRHGRRVLRLGRRATRGGESETIIGQLAGRARQPRRRRASRPRSASIAGRSRASRAATSSAPPRTRSRACGTDRIDLYYAHLDDQDTPLEETLAAFDELVDAGKVRYIAASNYSRRALAEALAVTRADGLPAYVALQPHYNLVDRDDTRASCADLCVREGLGVLPYFALAGGFLTGKYRPGGADDELAARPAARGVPGRSRARACWPRSTRSPRPRHAVAAVALAWLAAQPPWPRRSPARARPSSSRSCCRWPTSSSASPSSSASRAPARP